MSVSILESRTQNNIKNTEKEIFLTLAISGGYPGHSCGLGMDHLSYTWKTGLQGDQGAPGVPVGYTMDPGYHLLPPSAPLLDTTSSHPYAPR